MNQRPLIPQSVTLPTLPRAGEFKISFLRNAHDLEDVSISPIFNSFSITILNPATTVGQVEREHLNHLSTLLGDLNGLPAGTAEAVAGSLAGGMARGLEDAESVVLMQVGPQGVTIDSSGAGQGSQGNYSKV